MLTVVLIFLILLLCCIWCCICFLCLLMRKRRREKYHRGTMAAADILIGDGLMSHDVRRSPCTRDPLLASALGPSKSQPLPNTHAWQAPPAPPMPPPATGGRRSTMMAVKAWLGGIMGTQGQLAGHAQPAAPPPLSQDSAEYLDREAMSVRPSGREEKVTTTIVSDDDNMRVSESPQLMTGAG